MPEWTNLWVNLEGMHVRSMTIPVSSNRKERSQPFVNKKLFQKLSCFFSNRLQITKPSYHSFFWRELPLLKYKQGVHFLLFKLFWKTLSEKYQFHQKQGNCTKRRGLAHKGNDNIPKEYWYLSFTQLFNPFDLPYKLLHFSLECFWRNSYLSFSIGKYCWVNPT